jgi:hypothetical protein
MRGRARLVDRDNTLAGQLESDKSILLCDVANVLILRASHCSAHTRLRTPNERVQRSRSGGEGSSVEVSEGVVIGSFRPVDLHSNCSSTLETHACSARRFGEEALGEQ